LTHFGKGLPTKAKAVKGQNFTVLQKQTPKGSDRFVFRIVLPPPPWDPWTLDSDFFDSMSQWAIDHPESSLDRVFDKICVGIDNGMPLLDLIPDSPFPARSLVEALGHLVKLGVVRV
jgi:hypothetical protein